MLFFTLFFSPFLLRCSAPHCQPPGCRCAPPRQSCRPADRRLQLQRCRACGSMSATELGFGGVDKAALACSLRSYLRALLCMLCALCRDDPECVSVEDLHNPKARYCHCLAPEAELRCAVGLMLQQGLGHGARATQEGEPKPPSSPRWAPAPGPAGEGGPGGGAGPPSGPGAYSPSVC